MKTKTITSTLIASFFSPRKRDAHKGDFGHVLALAGARGTSGAAVLCANAALRSGAGLVTLGLPEPESVAAIGRLRPEIMTLPLPAAKSHSLSSSSLSTIIEYIERRRISALVIGPGLGVNDDSYALVKGILGKVSLPVVLDADALNVLAAKARKNGFCIAALNETRAKPIITPHPGEFARLTRLSIDEVQRDRTDLALRFARENGVVCVLKGYRTIVTDGRSLLENVTGNPGMATGGTGDVLAGMIGALIAQMPQAQLLNAALAGVYLHGLAGDIAAAAKTEIALIAGDIIETLPSAFAAAGAGKSSTRTHTR